MGNFRLEESYGIWSNTMKHFVIISLILNIVFGNTIIVDQMGDGDYLNINDAIINSSDNDTIQVRAGYYIEQLEFTSGHPSLTIIGAGKDICTLFYTNIPLYLHGYNGQFVIEGFTVEWGGAAGGGINISAGNGDYTIKKCAIIKPNVSADDVQGIGISGLNGSDISILNCLINVEGFGSNRRGITVSGSMTNSTVNIANSMIFGFHRGIDCSLSPSDYFLYNNIITGNTVGVTVADNISIVAMYNNVYGNSTNYSNSFVPGTGDISSDPLMIDMAAGDFRLGPGSPCFDTGAPWQQYNDIDGSRNDMGIFGGPHNLGGPGPVISNIQVSSEQVEQGGVITIQATGTVD